MAAYGWHIMVNPPFNQFDSNIRSVIPRYDELLEDSIDVVLNHHTPETWLDVGCGTGNLILKAIESSPGTSFTLLDISEDMLAIAREKLGDTHRYENYSSISMPFEDSSFDTVTCIQSTHYYEDDGHISALKECYRVLSENGILVVTENVASMSGEGYSVSRSRLKRFLLSQGKGEQECEDFLNRYGTEYFPRTAEEHISELKAVGFRNVEIFRYSFSQIGLFAIK